MFTEEKPHDIRTPLAPEAADEAAPTSDRRTMYIAVGAAVLVALLAGGGWWFFRTPAETPAGTPAATETPATGLPGTLNPIENTEDNGGFEPDPDLKGENVRFGEFYQSLADPIDIKAASVQLPLNVKSDVSNYYDVARRINLDPVISNLNRDGFAIIDNPFASTSQDFFGMYRDLSQRSIPNLVTSDFLMYYYQNSFKQLYKEIESSFFYDSLWKINKQLFEVANARYQARHEKLGIANDPLLEAERLEAAYFAASLAILKPSADQINPTEDLTDSRKFRPSEARRYEFSIPSYLADDVSKELQLIADAREVAKSPLLLYQRDYHDFIVPEEYAQSGKLRNFYIASRWQTSLFPLSYKDNACPDCLLDRDDWIINQTAAHLIAADLSGSQVLKNEWAKIYKVISFFTGLRSELTYIHYDAVRREVFGDKPVEELFAEKAFDNLTALRSKLLGLKFLEAEGSLSRTEDAPYIGMRLLQTFYWPSRNIYDRLTYDPVGRHAKPLDSRGDVMRYLTSCDTKQQLYRCRAIGYDVIGLVAERKPSSRFLLDNISYSGYGRQADAIRAELKAFSQNSWHNNNFWTTLSAVGALVNETQPLPYANNDRWYERKLTTALAGMANLALDRDSWEVPRTQGSSGLETSSALATLNYVEPNAGFADEIVANATMLFKTLASLGVVKDSDPRFSDLISKLSMSRTLIRKQLAGEKLSNEDYEFIAEFVGQYAVAKGGAKTASIPFVDGERKLTLKQTIVPPRLLLLIYEKDGKKVLAAGPVFSYKEE